MEIYKILQSLIRFDTTNPPGNEAPCIQFIDELLQSAGFETTLLAKEQNRPNLITRLKGHGQAPPLLLYGHVDVVPAGGQHWTHPPFEGKIVDGYLWGRGALDMKGGIAMMLSALLRAHAEGLRPAGDIILAILCDEEEGSDYGAGFLVEEYPQLFEGVRYALGEFGGASAQVLGRTFYPIQVTEKQFCGLKATVRGTSGHAALMAHDSAMTKLAWTLNQLERTLPVHITPPARQTIEAACSALPSPLAFALRLTLNPFLAGMALKLLGEDGRILEPLLRNTVNATMVRGGDKINVIPGEIILGLDGRLLPGYHPQDILNELRDILGEDVELEVVRFDPGPPGVEMGLFDALANVIRDMDPAGIVIPMLMPGVSDARFFSRLGIQTYGFTPMKLPQEFKFFDLLHAADERISLDALDFGAEAVYRILQGYGDITDTAT